MLTKTHNYSQFYALVKQLPGGYDEKEVKEALVWQYTNGRTTSLREMKTTEYRQMCADMQSTISSANAKRDDNPDQWRKRVIAAVGEYLRRVKGSNNPDEIKGIACRATHYEDFNLIPVSRLRSLYNAFRKINEDYKNALNITIEEITILANLN